MQRRSPMLALLAVLSLGGLALTVAPGVAQAQTTGGTVISSLEYKNVDVREALRNLFRITKVSFDIDPMVQGTVTASFKNIPFDTALQNLAHQVDATYRLEAGIYKVVPRASQGESVAVPAQMKTPGQEPYMLVDGEFLFVLRDKSVYKIQKSTMKVVGTAKLE